MTTSPLHSIPASPFKPLVLGLKRKSVHVTKEVMYSDSVLDSEHDYNNLNDTKENVKPKENEITISKATTPSNNKNSSASPPYSFKKQRRRKKKLSSASFFTASDSDSDLDLGLDLDMDSYDAGSGSGSCSIEEVMKDAEDDDDDDDEIKKNALSGHDPSISINPSPKNHEKNTNQETSSWSSSPSHPPRPMVNSPEPWKSPDLPSVQTIDDVLQTIQDAKQVMTQQLSMITELFHSTEQLKQTCFQQLQQAKEQLDQRDLALSSLKEKKIQEVQSILKLSPT